MSARPRLCSATNARGVFAYRDGRRLDQFTFENTGGGLLSNHIYSIFIDREEVIWFGPDRGVCRYDPHALHVEAISADAESNFARTLFQSSDGTLWCGTNRGLFARDDDSSWREVAVLKGKVVHSMGEDSTGRLLVGTASGLFEGDKSSILRRGSASELTGGREFVRLENANATADNIRAISTLQGVVYLANFGRGVERLDGTKRTLEWPDESAGARERQVVSLHGENKRLWIGTADAGVFLFDGKQSTVDHRLDELIGASVWSIEGSVDNVLWLAGRIEACLERTGSLRRLECSLQTRLRPSAAA